MKRKHRFSGQVIAVVGGNGGLGSAIARAFVQEGAAVVLAGRNLASLQALAGDLGPACTYVHADLTEPEVLERMADEVFARHGRLDVVVNAAGRDVRKALVDHTVDEVTQTVAVNLTGAILLTRAVLPRLIQQGYGTVLHVGGFADGRLALPYYSADVASRAGLAGFVESMNRELAGTRVHLAYLSPSPSDTEAEKPFHPIWREMGLSIAPRQAVAEGLVDAAARGDRMVIMGGLATGLFTKLNALWPTLADCLVLNGYTRILRRYLDPSSAKPEMRSTRSHMVRRLAIGLVALSFVLYGLILLVPFLPFTLPVKAGITTGLVISGEASFWVGGLLLGKEVLGRIRQWLNPANWFRRSS